MVDTRFEPAEGPPRDGFEILAPGAGEADLPAPPAAEGAGGSAVPAEPGAEPGAGREAGHLGRLWREWIRPLGLVLLVMGSFRSAFADWNDVPTGSMKPTIVEGDRIFVNKLAYDLKLPFSCMLLPACLHLLEWGEPERGDIVVLFSPDDGIRLVKRVIGVPGDQIEVRGGRVRINGERLRYEPVHAEVFEAIDPGERSLFEFAREDLGRAEHAVMIGHHAGNRDNYGPVTVPADHYFVMGDNRSQSRDSRFFSFVDRRSIVGRATAVVYSDAEYRHWYRIRPRWHRFFQALE